MYIVAEEMCIFAQEVDGGVTARTARTVDTRRWEQKLVSAEVLEAGVVE